jgi:hypothetical protein
MGLTLDYEVADKITVLTLKDSLTYLQKELDDHANGGWLHPDDVTANAKYIDAIKIVLNYFGE